MLEDNQSHMHKRGRFGPERKVYIKQIIKISDLEEIPDILFDIAFDSIETSLEEPYEYPKYKFIVYLYRMKQYHHNSSKLELLQILISNNTKYVCSFSLPRKIPRLE